MSITGSAFRNPHVDGARRAGDADTLYIRWTRGDEMKISCVANARALNRTTTTESGVKEIIAIW